MPATWHEQTSGDVDASNEVRPRRVLYERLVRSLPSMKSPRRCAARLEGRYERANTSDDSGGALSAIMTGNALDIQQRRRTAALGAELRDRVKVGVPTAARDRALLQRRRLFGGAETRLGPCSWRAARADRRRRDRDAAGLQARTALARMTSYLSG